MGLRFSKPDDDGLLPGAVLVRRAAQGDRAAFDQLVDRYRGALLARAFMRTSDRDQAEDLVQEVITRAWQQLPTLRDPEVFLPWLKTILANHCHSWLRHARVQPSIGAAAECCGLPDTRPSPLESLLLGERQRELREALLHLPEVNRTALLMSVWGGSTYQEIADYANVPVTTVEGRIFRGKQKLRCLLYDHGADFLGTAERSGLTKSILRSKSMPTLHEPTAQKNTRPPQWDNARTLISFTLRFAALIDTGPMSLVQIIQTLEELPSPYGQAAQELRQQVEQGQMLSKAMSRMPNLFSQCYCGLVHAGLVSGLLEETLARIGELLVKEWQLASRRPKREMPVFLLLPSETPLASDWAELTAYQQNMGRVVFLETFGKLLVSGVPILQTMETMAALLPEKQAAQWMAARLDIREGNPLIPNVIRMGVFPQFVIAMMAGGEQAGCLDRTLHQAAEVLERELDLGLMSDVSAPMALSEMAAVHMGQRGETFPEARR